MQLGGVPSTNRVASQNYHTARGPRTFLASPVVTGTVCTSSHKGCSGSSPMQRCAIDRLQSIAVLRETLMRRLAILALNSRHLEYGSLPAALQQQHSFFRTRSHVLCVHELTLALPPAMPPLSQDALCHCCAVVTSRLMLMFGHVSEYMYIFIHIYMTVSRNAVHAILLKRQLAHKPCTNLARPCATWFKGV